MSFKVVLAFGLPGVDLGEALLEPFDVSLVKGVWQTEDEIISNARDADAVIGVGTFQPFSRRVLESLGNCRLLAGIGIGFETFDLDAATEYGIAVTRLGHIEEGDKQVVIQPLQATYSPM